MNVAANPLLGVVVDGIVDGVRVADLLVGLQLVGVNRGGIVSNHSIQERGDLALAVIPSFAEPELSAALDSAENRGLVGPPVEAVREAATAIGPLPSLELAADECLVGLNDAHQQGSLSLHH